MKLLITTESSSREFSRLLDTYKSYYFLTAWAGMPFYLSNKVLSNKNRIKQVVIGLHFYQTHPDFIKAFMDCKNIRYIKQTSGVFHPKVYLFMNSDTDWELFIGSSNFTKSAFSINCEANVIISSFDKDADQILQQLQDQINFLWDTASCFDKDELDKYEKIWIRQQDKVKSISGEYGNGGPQNNSRPLFNIPIATKNWNSFSEEVQNDKKGSIHIRLRVLEEAHNLFLKNKSFADFSLEDRKKIAGISYDKRNEQWLFFGSMKGSGDFKKRIIDNDKNISIALEQIPLSGAVFKSHFDDFIAYFLKSTKHKNPIATATRLLAMKRPDYFVCLDSKNRKNMCDEFGIRYSQMTLERYWTDIIQRVQDCEWYKNANTINELEIRIWNNRCALLDSICYDS